jgi:hypothetical protein
MIAAALAFALQVSGPVLEARDLKKAMASWRAQPAAAPAPVRFRLEFPLIPDRKTDLASLQSPAGYAYDPKTGVLSIDVGMGAATPENFVDFAKLGLDHAPPLRTLFFESRTTKASVLHIVPDQRGDAHGASGWDVVGESLGLAVPASAQAYGVSGGDLPDGLTIPFVMQLRIAPEQLDFAVRSLRLRVEGFTRTIGGRAILCSNSGGGGYVVDEFTQKTPNVIRVHQCLAPAVLTRVALVRVAGGSALKEWTRAAIDPTPETPETTVITTGTKFRTVTKPAIAPPNSTPAATDPLPRR